MKETDWPYDEVQRMQTAQWIQRAMWSAYSHNLYTLDVEEAHCAGTNSSSNGPNGKSMMADSENANEIVLENDERDHSWSTTPNKTDHGGIGCHIGVRVDNIQCGVSVDVHHVGLHRVAIGY